MKVRLTKINPIIAALILSIAVFLLRIVFCDPKFETNDDFIVSAVLSGAYTGTPDPHMFFSNILLGYILSFMYRIIPSVGWFFVFMECLGFFSAFAVFYLTLKNTKGIAGYILCFFFAALYLDDVFISVQFTKVASFAIIAGSVLFIDSLINKQDKVNTAGLICGMLLVISGSFLRFDCLYVAGLFVVIFLIRKIRIKYKSGNIISLIKPAVFGVCLVVSIIALNSANMMIWNSNDDYRDYRSFTIVRSSVTDLARHEDSNTLGSYQQLGLDYIDYDMLGSWGFRDNDVYGIDTLSKVASMEKDNQLSHRFDPVRITDKILSRGFFIYPSFAGLILIAALIFLDKDLRLYITAGLFAVLGLILAFTILDRIVYRVEYSIFISAAVIMCTAGACITVKPDVKRVFTTVCTVIAAIVSIYRIYCYIPDMSYKSLSDEEYVSYQTDSMYNAEDYLINRCRINISERRSLDVFIDRVEGDKDHYYMLDFLSCTQRLYINYRPWEALPQGYFRDNYIFLSGCDMNYPGEIYAMTENGIDTVNPYRSLINDNIYLVDNYLYELKLAYLRKYWYPDVHMELVDEIDGFKIWRFYV